MHWGFLIGEIWGLILLAALLGLLAGWLIWHRRHGAEDHASTELRRELDACKSRNAELEAQIGSGESTNSTASSLGAAAALSTDSAIYEESVSTSYHADDANHEADEIMESESSSTDEVAAEEASTAQLGDADYDYDGDGIIEGTNEGTRPAALTAARDGGADDLKRIKGIGPKLEILCNTLGFYHFDQIAAWTSDEVAWVDANLEGFKGRVTRDDWVGQAKLLASGQETEFSQRVDKGDVY